MQELPDVLNWRRLDDNVTLSGQPTEQQLAQIRELGVSTIINLGPHTNEGALIDEAASVAALGMEYVYIPVDFDNPSDADFDQFCEAMGRVEGAKTHVHCIYNARVTAFFYRYAKVGLGGSVDDAFQRMDGIWRPGGVWANFIGSDQDIGKPNRFLGYDY